MSILPLPNTTPILLLNFHSADLVSEIALFHLRCQNAGLLVTARQDDILFEAFELLAPNNHVMSCQGALLREFPDRAAVLARDKVLDDSFLDVLVDAMQKLDVSTAPVARPETSKAGTTQPEERDTVSPILITGMLIDVLVGLGRSIEPDRITKRSREQVGWSDAALPFHRSPTWLLLCVALRLVLDRSAVRSGEESWYKPLIAYHHARILAMATQEATPPVLSDTLFSMTAKLSRRITKLHPVEEPGWLGQIRDIATQSHAVLSNRWEKVQDRNNMVLPLDKLPDLSFEQDCELRLQKLRPYLGWIKSRATSDRSPMGPGDTTRFISLRPSEPPALGSEAPKDPSMDLIQLLDFEAWVESALPGWSESKMDPSAPNTNLEASESAVRTLQHLIDVYYERARAAYEGIPDGLSVMYIVIMELWVALDKIAGHNIRLLLDYDPGFPLDAFCPLLLERKEEMARLRNLEYYLSRRREAVPTPYSSAFDGFGRDTSFAVRLFETSSEHQRLRVEIESWAARKEQEKLQQFNEMKTKHDDLLEKLRHMSCEFEWNERSGRHLHNVYSCAQCCLQREIDSLEINIFEWPLPTAADHSKAAVVEIRIPPIVQMWRDVTWKLVTEVFRQRRGGDGERRESLYFAGDHSGLRRLSGRDSSSRLQPASTVKPMEVAHYKRKHISDATPDNVCVPHAAQYAYYDEPSRLLAVEEIPGACIPAHCSYAELAKESPAELAKETPPVEDWIRYARHSSNDVIAGQSRCPLDTTLEEFRAFGNLRSGFVLQWANIQCQLVIPSVDFNKKETFALIMQACLEAGPANNSLEGGDSIWREAHIDTQREDFMNQMLQDLEEAFERVHESWQNDIALCLLACLATRLLSLSPSSEISDRLLGYLARVRKASIAWARLLLDNLNDSNVDKERREWTERLLMAALISAATFNVGEEHLVSTLSDPKHLAHFVESAVLARNHMPASDRPSDPITHQLVRRWQVVMYRARGIAQGEIVGKGNSGLDQAIKQFWADYSPPSTGWTPANVSDQSHILERSNSQLSVCFNLLTGNLFVNGYPLSKLPLDYQQHPTFRDLFGEQILDVGPSSVPGMQFSACRDQNGWVVHFAMNDGHLVVRAVPQRDQSDSAAENNSLETWEYIPKDHLHEDVPNSFVNNYAHWLNLSTDQVEFRPISQKWTASSENWHLVRSSGRDVLRKGERFVVDPFSPTALLVDDILGSIESRWNINAIFDRGSRTMLLELPRLSLSFSVREGEAIAKSRDYPGMQVDQGQNISALIGLRDKLVLKPDGGRGFRTILVPRGQVSARYDKILDHVEVSILRENDRKVRHDSFAVNTELGCLTDTGSLHSKLFLCWLHALTSHSLPDPLTHRTGTEEALRILTRADINSYQVLDHDSRGFLGEIAKLSPRREYYPSHLRVMERTTWNHDIPPLSQHDDFWPLAESTYQSYQNFAKLFQLAGGESPTAAPNVFKQKRSSDLHARARIRNSIFRVSEFGAEEHTTTKDKWYRPCDRLNAGSAIERTQVASLTRCVDTRDERLLFRTSPDLKRKVLKANGRDFSGFDTLDLAFDIDCLGSLQEWLEGRWCGLHMALVNEKNKYRKILFLSSLLYAKGADQQIVQLLMALGNIQIFSEAHMLPPRERKFDLDVNRETFPGLSGILTEIVDTGAKRIEECPEWGLLKHQWESWDTFSNRQRREWRSSSAEKRGRFVAALMSQTRHSWEVKTPTDDRYTTYLDVDVIMPKVRDQVELARRTEAFHLYLDSVSGQLDVTDQIDNCNLAVTPTYRTNRPSSRLGFISAMSLFSQRAPLPSHPQPRLFPTLCAEFQAPEQKHSQLSALVDELSVSSLQDHQRSYICELRGSMESSAPPRRLMSVSRDDPAIQLLLDRNLQAARSKYDAIHEHLRFALTGTSIKHQICAKAGFGPQITPVFLLQRLTRAFWPQLSTEWKRGLVGFALALVYLQRAERLTSHAQDLPERWSDLQRELSNPGDHDNPEWDPLEFPEGLLLEIEQEIMIRPVQNKIATAMRSPPGMENSVMQLNMGEGKSTVIVPVVAAALADGTRLVRVVVAKPQSSQMTHMLISRLSGLINRRIFYLPISRSIRLDVDGVQAIRGMIETCQREGGILLVQPEHLLSFKLMGIDRSWAEAGGGGQGTLGQNIISLYQDFQSTSRDIVDESDENFSVKFELIYTMGTQEAVEMSPDRWILIQELLGMAELVVRGKMNSDTPEAGVREGLLFEDHGAGRVPVIRILGESAGREVVRTLAAEVCSRGLRGLPVHHQTMQMREAVLNYILLETPATEDIERVESSHHDTGLFNDPTTKNAILLLRGLLAKGVLLFALGQKRFRVNYGLAPDRQPPTKLAVPYRAKDIPSPRSEFSHPDVVIVLTCLSYYYHGLSDAELYTCLDLLNNSDQADEEYGRWAAACPKLPPSFRHFSSVNLKHRSQCEDMIFPNIRYARPVVDFYLNRVVFAKEMKQFPFKLSASGWDLAKTQDGQPVTGFSGTNDSKEVLPLSIKALNLQPHTNATVLSTALGEENKVLELGGGGRSQISALTEGMICALVKPEQAMQVILDVGAQIIESSNRQMAEKLLESDSPGCFDAVIFFNHQDELSVLTRDGTVDSFLTSPFATHTDRCLVFLDQAHTRGTDLKLPDHYRAAVTLGPGVTKDTLVQACMRMRKLGQGQAVTFIVSPEMQKRIRDTRDITDGRALAVRDVLAWAISESWDEAARSVPLWATQGRRHLRQEEIWHQADEEGGFPPSALQEYLEPEAMSLGQRYRITSDNDRDLLTHNMASLSLHPQLAAIDQKLRAFSGSAGTTSSTLQEEQERELAPEIEEERQVSRPPPRQALSHNLHQHVESFIQTGHIPPGSPAFTNPFASLTATTAAALFPAPLSSSFPCALLATRDFARTVDDTGPGYVSDAYQRSVQWVLTTGTDGTDGGGKTTMRMVVVSPYEAAWAKRFLERRQHSSGGGAAVTLHAYLPRPSLSFRSMEDLRTYTVPPVAEGWQAPLQLVTQLNLFAGQLYLRDYEEYVRLCRYLGLAYTENKRDEVVGRDGFVGRRGYAECEFEESPVAFLAEVFGRVRRDCVGIEKTHMGMLLAGEILGGERW